MIRWRHVLAAAVAAAVTAGSVSAETFKWAFQGDLKSLDPYTLNETFTLGFLGNVYEGLTRRGPDLAIQPSLAESWEVMDDRWRFYLRQGVTFHNGNDFTADDVVFSANRVRSEGSDLRTRVSADVTVEKVDDYTVDFFFTGANPILHYEWDTWYIVDKEWSEANDSVAVTSASDENAS
jgi:peptide/nickel transport system substrate-binding protein